MGSLSESCYRFFASCRPDWSSHDQPELRQSWGTVLVGFLQLLRCLNQLVSVRYADIAGSVQACGGWCRSGDSANADRAVDVR